MEDTPSGLPTNKQPVFKYEWADFTTGVFPGSAHKDQLHSHLAGLGYRVQDLLQTNSSDREEADIVLLALLGVHSKLVDERNDYPSVATMTDFTDHSNFSLEIQPVLGISFWDYITKGVKATDLRRDIVFTFQVHKEAKLEQYFVAREMFIPEANVVLKSMDRSSIPPVPYKQTH